MAVAIIGAQYGSEGKGVVSAALAHGFDAAVRVGGPNAGHSFRIRAQGDYLTYKMRGIPCAWVNEEAHLFIGAGAVVDPELLARELSELPRHVQVFVDSTAAVVTHADGVMERDAGLDSIGSTLEGVGWSRSRKMSRRWPTKQGYVIAADYDLWHERAIVMPRVNERIIAMERAGAAVMLEGTQGSGLSLDHGIKYPFATSADTNVSGLLSQVGLPPSAVTSRGGHVFLVARTLPIRVGGNSGPMPGGELTWEEVQQHAGVKAPERTTVTNKIRRISRWDPEVFSRAIGLNDPCGVFLMFADYLTPAMAGTEDAGALLDTSSTGYLGDLRRLTQEIEEVHRVPIVAYGTGGPGWSLAFRGRCAHGDVWDPKA